MKRETTHYNITQLTNQSIFVERGKKINVP